MQTSHSNRSIPIETSLTGSVKSIQLLVFDSTALPLIQFFTVGYLKINSLVLFKFHFKLTAFDELAQRIQLVVYINQIIFSPDVQQMQLTARCFAPMH